MPNPAVFTSYGQPVRSFGDYSNEIERGRFLQNQNAIQQAAMADRQQQQAAAQQKQNALMALTQQSGGDPEKLIPALYQGGFVGEAQALEKHRADVRKTGAEADAKAGDVQKARIAAYRDVMKTIPDPQQAAEVLQAMIGDPSLKGSPVAGIPLDAALQQMQTFPGGFAEWRNSFVLDADKYISEKRQAAADAQQARNDLIGPDGKPNQQLIDVKRGIAQSGAAQTNVSYGALTPVQLPDGTMAFAQGSNKGGAQIVPGMAPPPQNRDTKLPAELQRMQIAGDAMVKLMDDYEGMLKKHNPRDPMTQANPTVRADMQALKRNIELQFKELQALGALAGPDIEIMRQSLSDPFTVSGAYYGKEGLLAQVKRARELVKTRADAVMKSQGKPGAPAPAEDSDPLGLRK